MNIDKSYLSKIISSHEKNGYILKMPSDTDKRVYNLFLTDSGRSRALKFIENSNVEIGDVLTCLSDDEQNQMYEALETIIGLLKKGV